MHICKTGKGEYMYSCMTCRYLVVIVCVICICGYAGAELRLYISPDGNDDNDVVITKPAKGTYPASQPTVLDDDDRSFRRREFNHGFGLIRTPFAGAPGAHQD